MKALIIGIEGFVGKYLSDYLLTHNYKVYGTYLDLEGTHKLDKNIDLYRLDILESEQVKKVASIIKPDIIFHLAAQSSAALSWKQPQLTIQVNINGTLNVIEAVKALELQTRVMLIGSSEEYGYIRPEDIPVDESQQLRPGNPYAISKIAQSMFGELYAKSYNMDIVIIRAFNHIGPGQSEQFVVSDFAKRIAMMEKGLMDPVLLVGNLEAERDFTDVRDIVRAYEELARKGIAGEIYNVGSGRSHRIKEILNILLNLSSIAIRIVNDSNRDRPSDVPKTECNSNKIKQLTGWKAEYNLSCTLKDVLDYWRSIYRGV